jgi:two-component sensor histidine kinase
LIHEKLYRTTGLNNINFAEYLEELVNSLWESYLEQDTAIELSLALEPVWLNLETANPCGLIVNELISNALQHAFPDETKGKVWVKLWTNPVDQQINLKIEDNGIGLPNQIDMNQLKSLGLELIFTLTEQIQGHLSIENKQGTSFHICFPEVQYCPRY